MRHVKELWVRIALAGGPSMNHIEPQILCGPATTALNIQYAVSEILFRPRHEVPLCYDLIKD